MVTSSAKTFRAGRPPYWHAPHSSSSRMWVTIPALLPVFLAGLIFDFVDGLRVFSIAVSFGLFWDYLFAKLSRQKSSFSDGHTVFLSMLFAFLMPPQTPGGVIVMGTFFTVFLGKKCFGSWGESFFQPALLGRASVFVLFPDQVTRSFEYVGNLFPASSASFFGWLSGSSSVAIGEMSAIASIAGGIYLIQKRLIAWQIPFYFILSVCVFSVLSGDKSIESILVGGVFFCGFFVITDSTSPTGMRGRILFAVGSGVLTVVFRKWLTYSEATTYAILLMNALTPLIDRHLQKRFWGAQ